MIPIVGCLIQKGQPWSRYIYKQNYIDSDGYIYKVVYVYVYTCVCVCINQGKKLTWIEVSGKMRGTSGKGPESYREGKDRENNMITFKVKLSFQRKNFTFSSSWNLSLILEAHLFCIFFLLYYHLLLTDAENNWFTSLEDVYLTLRK